MEDWFPTVASVRVLISTTLTDEQIQEIMLDAHAMTARCIDSLPEATKKAIVKYVTAHIISGIPGASSMTGTGAVSSESLGDASISFATREMGSDLKGTTFGQTAIALDPNGCLNRIGKGTATIEVLRSSSRHRNDSW